MQYCNALLLKVTFLDSDFQAFFNVLKDLKYTQVHIKHN